MNSLSCHFCGQSLPDGARFCDQCGCEFRNETGNPYVTENPIQKRLAAIAAIAVAFSVLLTSVAFASAGSAGLAFVSTMMPKFGSSAGLDDASGLLDDSFSSDTGLDSGSDDGSDYGTDDGSDTGTDYSDTYGLTDAQIAEGYVLNDDGMLAWRWSTAAESAARTCSYDSTTCTWVSVYAVQDCPAVLVNTHVSLSANSDTNEETAVGYGNDSIDDASMYAGETQLIEVDGYNDYSGQDNWMFMSSLTCEMGGIGHD